jgi:hypothetical protein
MNPISCSDTASIVSTCRTLLFICIIYHFQKNKAWYISSCVRIIVNVFMNGLCVLLGPPLYTSRNQLGCVWNHLHQLFSASYLEHKWRNKLGIQYLCMQIHNTRWDIQNGNNPTYRKVHSKSQFILPFTLTSVLFHKFSPHPAHKNMFDVVTSQFSSLLKEMQNNTLVPSPLSKRVGYFQGNTLVPSPLSKSGIFSSEPSSCFSIKQKWDIFKEYSRISNK